MRAFAKPALVLTLLLGVAGALPVQAQESLPALITDVRVYNAGPGSVVFVSTSNISVCGTNVFKFNLNSASGQGMLSQAIAALVARRGVVLEIASTGCAGWGTALRSMTLTTRPVN